MAPKKYCDFIESAPVERRGKHPPHDIRAFVDIMCPHCNLVCAEIPEEHLKTSKASYCLQHLRVCESYEGQVNPAPKKQRVTPEELSRQLSEMEKRLNTEADEREKRIVTTVGAMVKLGPPPPTSKDDLYERLESKQADVETKETRLECMEANLCNIDHAQICGVCLEKPSDTIFVPCLHRNTCWEDWRTLEATAVAEAREPRCPTCRVAVTKAVRVVV